MLRGYLRRACAALLCAASLMPMAHAAGIQGPVKIVVGYPPGGAADAIARLYAEKLRGVLGVAVVVENRAGAGGQIAAQAFLSAPKDGSTLLLANSHMMSTLPLTIPSVQYDPVRDFVPVGQIARFEHVLVVGAGSGSGTLASYLEQVRKTPDAGLFGIPAPGSAPLTADLLGGHVAAGIDALGGMAEYHQAGRLKILAITGTARWEGLPDVPTFNELGYGTLDASGWIGLFAPKGTDGALIGRYNQALRDVAGASDMKAALLPLGFAPAAGSPEALGQAVASDLAFWKPLIEASGYQAQ